ncbi:hypothetical protein [Neptuniibacter halophilus]|uniref:hypothetical protein n=1 Tax=Neptuniibacter halophilus TaxID=651666 RepID=UPI0025730437|nr:hypothetical protein [Neptuniibacter halophilus]
MLNPCGLIRLLLLLVTGFSTVLWADEVEVNGFITQGYFYTSDNQFNGNSESGSFDFRELALNASWRISDELLLTGQVMSRRAGEVDDGDLAVDYAMLDYRFFEGQRSSLGIGVGRIKHPFGFYNKTRDVAFTRPSIVLPQSIYFDKARNLELSADGVRLYGQHLFDTGVLESELVVGWPKRDVNVEYAYLGQDWPGRFEDSAGLVWNTQLSSSDYAWIGGLTLGRLNLEYDSPSPAPGAPGSGDLDINLAVLSLQYNLEDWSFTGEYFRQDVDWTGLGGVFALIGENESESFYLQVEHRLSDQLSVFLRRDMLYLNRNDRDGKTASALLGIPAHTQYAFDWTLGVGWQPSRNWLFRAEWHRVEGSGWLASQENPDLSSLEEDWDMFTLQATYRF